MELACRNNTVFTSVAEAERYGREIDREGYNQLTAKADKLLHHILDTSLHISEVRFAQSQLYFIEVARSAYLNRELEAFE
jgi:hypothetical protein